MSKGFRRCVSCCVWAAALAVSLAATARADKAAPFETLETGHLKVCLYWGFAPFSSATCDKDNTVCTGWKGWDYDYVLKFATENGLKLDVIPTDFPDIWLEPSKGHCDIAGTGISDTKDRRAATDKAGHSRWSNTYYGVLRTFLVRTADFTKLTKVADLKGKKAIVTKDSTANSDLCYLMKEQKIHPCEKNDHDHPCFKFGNFPETNRNQDRSCVFIEYPQGKDEKNAANDVANSHSSDQDPGVPFTYGGGYGSVQDLVCSQGGQALATVWPHCNASSDGKAYAEPFSFVVRAPGAKPDVRLVHALNCYINSNKYAGTPIPVPDPPCPIPSWIPAPDKACSR